MIGNVKYDLKLKMLSRAPDTDDKRSNVRINVLKNEFKVSARFIRLLWALIKILVN